MKTDPEENLLDDLFSESPAGETHRDPLGTMLRAARQRRQRRQAGRAMAVVALVAATALLRQGIWKRQPAVTLAQKRAVESRPGKAGSSFQLVLTVPLARSMIVESDPKNVHWAENVPYGQGCAIVATRPGQGLFRPINDDQLLSLAGNAPVALIRAAAGKTLLLLLASGEEALARPGK